MNSVQESKNELDAAIRYAENAISSAKQTIESMEFRQEMAKKQYSEQTGREQALERELKELEEARGRAEGEVELLQSSIKQLERELTVQTANANAWKKEYDKLKEVNREAELEAENAKLRKDKERLTGLEIQLRDKIWELKEGVPTMPVIPKAVAIAIFREGMAYGAGNVCDELDNATDIEINETGYTGGFEVNFTKYFDLSDELDLDYLRSKAVDNSDEEWVVDCLKTLCADNKFECRIHGIDDQQTSTK